MGPALIFQDASGVLTLLCSGLLGVLCGAIYCNAPDAFSYGTGESVIGALQNIPRSQRLWLVVSAVVVVAGLIDVGPLYPTIADVPIYAVDVVIFISGFAFATDVQSAPLPDIVTVPFLCLAVTHAYPNYRNIADSALGFSSILLFRYLLGAVLVVVLVALKDSESPRLFGIISEQHWMFLSGAGAWVGYRHLAGLFVYIIPLVMFASFLRLLELFPRRGLNGISAKVATGNRSNIALTYQHTIPWGGSIAVAMIMEMVSRHMVEALVIIRQLISGG